MYLCQPSKPSQAGVVTGVVGVNDRWRVRFVYGPYESEISTISLIRVERFGTDSLPDAEFGLGDDSRLFPT